MKNLNRESEIYGLFSTRDNKIRYIGRTVSGIRRRLSDHIYDSTHPEISLCPDTYKARWIRKELSEGYHIDTILIEKTTVEFQDEREKYWISYYGRENLVNGTDGGNSVNPNKKKSLGFSYSKLKVCIQNNLIKGQKHCVINYHRTKGLPYFETDFLDEEYRRKMSIKFGYEIKNKITIREYLLLFNDYAKNKSNEYISNLKRICKNKYNKAMIEHFYEIRVIQKAYFIPKTYNTLYNQLFEIQIEMYERGLL